MGLLYRNTRLRELKIEVASWLVRFFDDRTLQFLCSSSLRSLDLDQLDHYELPMTQALVGHCPDTLEKLRLGFLEYHDKNAHKCHDARETAVPRILPNLRCLTVECMRIDNQLEIVLCDLIQSCPNLQELNLHRLHRLLPTTIPNIVAALIKYCPGLNSFHSPRFPAADMLRLIEGCPRIHTLEMEIRQEHLEHVIPSLALRYSSTLQVFRITENHLPPDQDNYISTILAHCACLKVMSIHATTYGIPLQDLIKVEWATTSLESLSLTIRSPAPALDQELLHREWKEQRYGYVDPDGGDPENQIAQAARLANMVLQFYTRIEAQPRLISPWMSWFNGWRSIPWEFAEEFTDGQLTEERQCKMSLYLPSIRKLDAHIRHAAKDKLDRDKERCLKEKLDLCNISVIDLERTAQSRDLHALAHLRSALDYTPLYMREINEAKDVAIAGDTAAEDSLPSDHEYSSYKSRNRRSSNNAKNKSRVCA
ncbi:hypothetical protein BGX33_000975 [Mortierella sp. NVP41]|nr:hypothetical protein BGX33_000975 [Mortierella sp. NVP41]